MMINLFMIFDPSTSSNYSFNWVSLLIVPIILPYQFWLMPSRYTMALNLMINFTYKEFKSMSKFSQTNIFMYSSLFIFIMINNLMGLAPYIFTPTSHINMVLSLSLPLWLGIMNYYIYLFFNKLMIHLTPSNTPMLLLPFMVIIESISLLIRPLTLTIRLSANMITGHLLLSLLGMYSSNSEFPMPMLILYSIQIILLVLEISVSLIQAYVFSALITLYCSEI